MNIFNNFFNDFEHVVFESPQEREEKKNRMKKLFSRVFLALFIYVMISQFLSTAIYTVAAFVFSAEDYHTFSNSYYVAVIISSISQYLIAFPVFALMLLRTDKAKPREKSKLTVKDFLLLFFISEALMFAGNLIGTLLNNVFGTIIGRQPENDIANIINDIPMYLIFILMVVIGPIVEELIFRKLMIDRLSIYGDRIAILFSAVSFGLIHANLYQFFYAALLGVLLGYVYTRTGKVKHTMFIHMAVNFFGSVVVLYAEKAIIEFERLYSLAIQGLPFDVLDLSYNALFSLLYTNTQYGMIIGGAIALWHFIKTNKLRISNEKEIYLPNSVIIREGVKNIGSLLFIISSVIFIILNLFTV